MASVLLVYSYKVGTGRPRYRGGGGGGRGERTYLRNASHLFLLLYSAHLVGRGGGREGK